MNVIICKICEERIMVADERKKSMIIETIKHLIKKHYDNKDLRKAIDGILNFSKKNFEVF